jgi:hypothetical protein
LPNHDQFTTIYTAKKGNFFSNDVIINLLGPKLLKTTEFFALNYIKLMIYAKNKVAALTGKSRNLGPICQIPKIKLPQIKPERNLNVENITIR